MRTAPLAMLLPGRMSSWSASMRRSDCCWANGCHSEQHFSGLRLFDGSESMVGIEQVRMRRNRQSRHAPRWLRPDTAGLTGWLPHRCSLAPALLYRPCSGILGRFIPKPGVDHPMGETHRHSNWTDRSGQVTISNAGHRTIGRRRFASSTATTPAMPTRPPRFE